MTKLKTKPSDDIHISRQPIQFKWIPQEDITAYELAVALPYLFGHNYLDELPENIRRHFKTEDK